MNVIDGRPGVSHWLEAVILGASLVVSLAAAIPILWRVLFREPFRRLIHATVGDAMEPTRKVANRAADEVAQIHGTLTRNGYTSDPPTLLDLVHDIQRQAGINQRLLMDHLEHSDETLAVVLPALVEAGALPADVVKQLHPERRTP